ncbi:MAG: rhomboid family intramembrane serine protease [Alcanivorax sp.]|uniref:rhomboid family intramembrane serine protease n=1 Tax=Alcanivorax sp. TaxID=1872427 RepID=UPI002632CD0F|nr:rhomboid family intramembrane serine protease [Alcanivorax sp.]MDF1725918.1 rhomboid family intramembrane serine protease [Alcanivorax sp.]
MPLPQRPKADSLTTLLKAPWVMAVIALSLLLGALLNPAQAPQPALSWYAASGLKTLEWNNYLSWLRFNGRGKLAGQLEQQLTNGDNHAYSAALLSTGFVKDSDQRARDFWSPAQIEKWKALRQHVPDQLATSNLYRWGLADSHPRPARFFTAPLTGGPLWLTSLTVLLLLPLAPSLERHLGHGRVLTLWLLGCLLAGAGYLLLARAGQMPFHGATAALMVWYGAFLGLQGWRSTLSIRLPGKAWTAISLPTPALAAIPLALLGILAWQSQPPMANLAAGVLALAGGILLVQVMGPAEPSQDVETVTPDATTQQALQRGWDALGRLQVEAAVDTFQHVLEQQPDHFDALTGLFTAHRMGQNTDDWLHIAHRLFTHPAVEKGQPQQIASCWQQFRQQQGTELPAQIGWPLVTTLTRAGDFAQAEALAASLDHHDTRKPALLALREALHREGLGHRAKALEV